MTFKRAIALAGGGPAVGLSLGSLKRLAEEPDLKFNVWTLSCIGAWLGIVWNQADPGQEYEQSLDFFKRVFRPDDVYDKFPIASVFAPDIGGSIKDMVEYAITPSSYNNLVVPDAILTAYEDILRFATTPNQWSAGNFNALVLNSVLAVNPVSRFMTSWIYKSKVNGLSRIYYKNSAILNQIKFDRLYQPDKPVLYHNSYNMTDQRLELFSNHNGKYQKIDAQTLCACSALPYIEEPVEMNGKVYCEGATIDTVCFKDLLENHPDLDEVWVSRILDVKQVNRPRNLYDALNNLVMLFAATTSEDDVKLFKFHAQQVKPDLKIIEIPVAANIDYDWDYTNLERSIKDGYLAAHKVVRAYQGYDDYSHSKLVSLANAKPRLAKNKELAQ